LYGVAPQVGTYVLLGVGDAESTDDAEATDDTGPVGEARPGVGAAAVEEADADETEPAGLEREAPAFDDPLEHPALSTRATPIPSAGTSQDRRSGERIARWYGNYIHLQYSYGSSQIFDSTSRTDSLPEGMGCLIDGQACPPISYRPAV
jgi:hypothetical protein